MTITLNLNQDSWNHIFSFTGLAGLKGALFTSKDLSIIINQYATTILVGFNLEVDQPTLSFKRLSNFQNLIDRWLVPNSPESDEYFNSTVFNLIYGTAFKELLTKKDFYLSKNYFDDIMIAYIKKYIIENLNLTNCTSPNFKGSLIPLNNTSELVANFSVLAFPDHPAIKDLDTFFLQNSESSLFALEHKQYEKLKELLEKNCDMISKDRDFWEQLIFASLINGDLKSFEIVFENLEKYINENLNQENNTIQLLKSAKYYPFIKGNKQEGFCKLWQVYKDKDSLDYYGAKTVEVAKILVEGEPANCQGLLASAIIHKNIEVAQFLLSKGADINHYVQNFYRPIQHIQDCETLQLLLPKINFLGLFKAFDVCNSPQFRRLIFREIVYRMRYILLAAVIIPAIYVAAVGLNVI